MSSFVPCIASATVATLLVTALQAPFGQTSREPWSRPLHTTECETLVFKNKDGVVRMRVGLIPEFAFEPAIELCDAKGKVRSRMRLETTGEPSLSLFADNGAPLLVMEQLDDTRLPSIQMMARQEQGQGQFAQLTLDVVRDRNSPGDPASTSTRGHILVGKPDGDLVFETTTK